MLKFWSLIYRLTGWYSPFAELAEYRMLKKQGLFDSADIDIEVGMWQAYHKFYRRMK